MTEWSYDLVSLIDEDDDRIADEWPLPARFRDPPKLYRAICALPVADGLRPAYVQSMRRAVKDSHQPRSFKLWTGQPGTVMISAIVRSGNLPEALALALQRIFELLAAARISIPPALATFITRVG